MSSAPRPPANYRAFVARFPELGRAWEAAGEAGRDGPLDDRTARLVKVGIAIGAYHEGAVHSAVRKAHAAGATQAEIDQVLALAASTIGFPRTAAAFTWTRDPASRPKRAKSR